MHGPREQLFARAGLAEDQHRGIGRRHFQQAAEGDAQRGRIADDVFEVVGVANLVGASGARRAAFRTQAGELAQLLCALNGDRHQVGDELQVGGDRGRPGQVASFFATSHGEREGVVGVRSHQLRPGVGRNLIAGSDPRFQGDSMGRRNEGNPREVQGFANLTKEVLDGRLDLVNAHRAEADDRGHETAGQLADLVPQGAACTEVVRHAGSRAVESEHRVYQPEGLLGRTIRHVPTGVHRTGDGGEKDVALAGWRNSEPSERSVGGVT